MRNKILTIVSSVAILAIGCGTPQQMTIQEATGRVKVTTPFSESKYRTDKDTYRAVQSYQHPDENVASQTSYLGAKSLLFSQIKSDLTSFIQDYLKTTRKGNVQDVTGDLDRKMGELAEGIVNDAVIAGTEMFKETDGRFTCYTLVEKSRNNSASQVYDKTIAEDDKLKILFDKKKFQEEYEKWKADRKN